MKKILLFFILSLCGTTILFAANNVNISKIMVGQVSAPGESLDGLTLSPSDTLQIFFEVEKPGINPSEITFTTFLNAKIIDTRNNSALTNYIALWGLNKGNYIIKVQATGRNGWEAVPVIMQFSVGNVSYTDQKNPEENKLMDNSGIELKTLILYGLVALSFLQLLVIGYLMLRKKKAEVTERPDPERRFTEPGDQHIKMPSEKEFAAKKNADLIAELKDMHLSYSQLKKELDAMKGTNTFLRNQITSLQLNVKNLEEANIQLASQKDKLMESKRQLQELQAQKDELFAMAVHDIKNPAAAIRSYVELLESYDLNANEQQQIMHSLVDTSSRIVNLAQQMSVIIAKQAPEPMLSLQPASIKTLIDSICNRNYAYAKRKNIKLINNSSPHTPKTLLDISKMEEVVDNLINNAIKFAPEGTVVQVRTFFSDSKITVEVEDNGVGLTEEDIKRAFEKGARLSAQPTGGETSSGLGLWIVKNVIEEHGGEVWIKSKPGMGSTFGFELPMVKKN